MGQIQNEECGRVEDELRAAFPGSAVECRIDTYTQDYIIWIEVNGETFPIRITREEYLQDDWKGNIRLLLTQTH